MLFRSATDLVSGDVEPFTQNIFRRDLLTGNTRLLSFNRARTGSGDNHGYYPSISADGRAVDQQLRLGPHRVR